MSSTFSRDHPDEFHNPGWDVETERPAVEGLYHNPETAKLRIAIGSVYSGPPAVDVVS